MNTECKPLRRVVLIDDDATDNLFHRRVLERSNLVEQVVAFERGEEALDYLRSTADRVDVLFVDLNMPRMNGFDFLIAYQSTECGLASKPQVVLLSTSINPAEVRQVGARFPWLLTEEKPLNLEKLQRFIAAGDASGMTK